MAREQQNPQRSAATGAQEQREQLHVAREGREEEGRGVRRRDGLAVGARGQEDLHDQRLARLDLAPQNWHA